MSDIGPWSQIIVRHAKDAFGSAETIASQWRGLNFTAAPDYTRGVAQYERFVEALRTSGAQIVFHPARAEAHALQNTANGPQGVPNFPQEVPGFPQEVPGFSPGQHTPTLDSIYVRDASVMAPRGAILCRMGKPQREGEPDALAETYRALGIPILGAIEAPGKLEGGDVTWLGPRLVAAGRGYRTNDEGIRQLRALLDNSVDEVITVPLPHYRGPGDVFHLMSIISPVDTSLAVVYSPLMPVPFRERLLDLGYTLAEVPDDEFDSMGTNVFALAPRRCLMVEGNPKTRAALERAGADVVTYDGSEISLKGGGGPTCLTRPII
jgi:N-dimethylarginine dimethylaminohydrolase